MTKNAGRKNSNTINDTRSRKGKELIWQHGYTWEQATAAVGLKSVKYFRLDIVRPSYKTKRGFEELDAKAKANAKAQKTVNSLVGSTPTSDTSSEEAEVKEVILIETGYLMRTGPQGIMSESLPIFMPYFCMGELEKLARTQKMARDLLTFIHGYNKITTLNLRGKEEIFSEPEKLVKSRVPGVVATACFLWAEGYQVRLLTNSSEIEKLANNQEIGINVVNISRK